jgi:transposase
MIAVEFQQDNAPTNISNQTEHWFEENGIDVFRTPLNSPDLNLMKNAWAILSSKVYQDKTLNSAILGCWGEIAMDELRVQIR